jgi:tetratricopeptide (TPR) repeat protein
LTSVLLHVACTVMFYCLARRFTSRPSLAWLAAALFAVHPAHVEAITWASAMGDLLVTALMLSAALTFLRFAEGGGLLWCAASVVLSACDMLTKETGVVVPALLLISALLLSRRRRGWQQVLLASLPSFLLVPLYLVIRASALETEGGITHLQGGISTASMILTWPAVLLFDLRHLCWPSVVVPNYPVLPPSSPEAALLPAATLVLLVALFAFLLWRAAGARTFVFCAAWLLLPLAPVLYLKAFIDYEYVHDRFLYAPALGFTLAAAVLLGCVAGKLQAYLPNRALPLLAALLILLWSYSTVDNTFWWQDDVTLFTRDVKVTPRYSYAWVNLGYAYLQVHREAEAIAAYQHSLALRPTPDALYALGYLAWTHGDYAGAEPNLAASVQLQPRADHLMLLSIVATRLGHYEAAEDAVRRSMAINPDVSGIHHLLGTILFARGRRDEAIAQFKEELRLFPSSEAARKALQIATSGSK